MLEGGGFGEAVAPAVVAGAQGGTAKGAGPVVPVAIGLGEAGVEADRGLVLVVGEGRLGPVGGEQLGDGTPAVVAGVFRFSGGG